MKQFKIGLKLWSSNDYYVKPAVVLYEKGLFDYIELYSQPGTFGKYSPFWKDLDIPYHIHAPHFSEGMNLAKKENERSNLLLAEEALRYADTLKADKVIIHPGVSGDTGETIRQLNLINDKRLIVENKPYFSVDGKYVCNGYSPEELERIMNETGLGFCLDFGHAICSANAQKLEPMGYIAMFLELKPAMYHLTDGDYNSPYDSHQHYGKGSFPLKQLFAMVPADSFVTNEAVKDSKSDLDDFIADIFYIKDRFFK